MHLWIVFPSFTGNMVVNFSNDKGSQNFSQGSIRCLNSDEFDIGPSQRVNSFISNLSGMMVSSFLYSNLVLEMFFFINNDEE